MVPVSIHRSLLGHVHQLIQTYLSITLAPRMVVFLGFLLLVGSAWAYGLIRSPLGH